MTAPSFQAERIFLLMLTRPHRKPQHQSSSGGGYQHCSGFTRNTNHHRVVATSIAVVSLATPIIIGWWLPALQWFHSQHQSSSGGGYQHCSGFTRNTNHHRVVATSIAVVSLQHKSSSGGGYQHCSGFTATQIIIGWWLPALQWFHRNTNHHRVVATSIAVVSLQHKSSSGGGYQHCSGFTATQIIIGWWLPALQWFHCNTNHHRVVATSIAVVSLQHKSSSGGGYQHCSGFTATQIIIGWWLPALQWFHCNKNHHRVVATSIAVVSLQQKSSSGGGYQHCSGFTRNTNHHRVVATSIAVVSLATPIIIGWWLPALQWFHSQHQSSSGGGYQHCSGFTRNTNHHRVVATSIAVVSLATPIIIGWWLPALQWFHSQHKSSSGGGYQHCSGFTRNTNHHRVVATSIAVVSLATPIIIGWWLPALQWFHSQHQSSSGGGYQHCSGFTRNTNHHRVVATSIAVVSLQNAAASCGSVFACNGGKNGTK